MRAVLLTGHGGLEKLEYREAGLRTTVPRNLGRNSGRRPVRGRPRQTRWPAGRWQPPAGGLLTCHHRLDEVRAHLLEMAGEFAVARSCYRTAARRTTSLPGT